MSHKNEKNEIIHEQKSITASCNAKPSFRLRLFKILTVNSKDGLRDNLLRQPISLYFYTLFSNSNRYQLRSELCSVCLCVHTRTRTLKILLASESLQPAAVSYNRIKGQQKKLRNSALEGQLTFFFFFLILP